MLAYFCSKTGARLVAPGVSKLVDPVNGVELYEDPAPMIPEEPKKEPKPKGGK